MRDGGTRGVGKVWLVGAGPGAADLLTLRAARLLAEADVVLHDELVGAEVLELAVRAQRIPVGKRCGKPSARQADINRQLVHAARAHRCVVRLKGGDPVVFGRLDEEIAALESAGIAWEVVPGITAASAAAAAVGCSLTSRGKTRQVTFATPSCDPRDGADVASALKIAPGATAVFYMAGRMSARMGQLLLERGYAPSTPAVIVSNASRVDQRVHWTTVAMLAVAPPDTAGAPALIMAGELARAPSAQPLEQDRQADDAPHQRA